MKYTIHIVDVFSAAPFGGNQLAVLPDAAGISTDGMPNEAQHRSMRKGRPKYASIPPIPSPSGVLRAAHAPGIGVHIHRSAQMIGR
jgi:hypothetical protein